MIFHKYQKLLGKFIGNIVRPRYSWKKNVTKIAKFLFLLIECPVEVIGDILFFWKRSYKTPVANPKRILIIKIDQFGDVLFSTFLLPIIKKQYPACEIDYLINPKTAPLLKNNPHITHLYYWENIFLLTLLGREKSRSGDLREIRSRNRATMRELITRNYDAVLNTRAYPPSSNIPWRRIGGRLIAFDISEQSFLADFWARYELTEEEWINYLNLLEPLGIDIESAEFSPGFFNLSDTNPMGSGKKYVVISPISFDKERQWPKEEWKKLISGLVGLGYQVALTGMPTQKAYLEKLILPQNGGSVVVLNTLSLAEFGTLMKDAEFFVGIESFPAHLALAFKREVFCLVNNDSYYLKGFSKRRLVIDARSMLPIVGNIHFLDLKTAKAADVLTDHHFK